MNITLKKTFFNLILLINATYIVFEYNKEFISFVYMCNNEINPIHLRIFFNMISFNSFVKTSGESLQECKQRAPANLRITPSPNH